MSLRITTREIISIAEETSGFPVVVEEDENLSTLVLLTCVAQKLKKRISPVPN